MTDKILYWSTVIFSSMAMILFLSNVALVNGNRDLQGDINARQNSINIATNLAPLNQNLAQALAEISTKNDDKDIEGLLASQGITIRKPDAKADAGAKADTAKKPAAKKTSATEE